MPLINFLNAMKSDLTEKINEKFEAMNEKFEAVNEKIDAQGVALKEKIAEARSDMVYKSPMILGSTVAVILALPVLFIQLGSLIRFFGAWAKAASNLEVE